ncbi:MAG: uroporphyrinogen decarboxylase family protein [Lachnospiraceae bacterium]|jgi:uroporphyrinogen decarboxylase|nr:uroporphyrinogen decarboxylase family protein [Lachnospiraceae bacterium]MDD3615291.1 uroporphyrinogen decarboxylase family protein [Lachnospiraceae bacterium]
MTSRERVMASINHKEPDELAMDLGSNVSAGISGVAYTNLKDYLGMSGGHTRIYDVVQQVAQPELEVLDLVGADVLDVGRVYNEKDSDWYDVTLCNGKTGQWPSWFKPVHMEDGSYNVYAADGTHIARMPKGGMCFDQMYFPYRNAFPDNYDNLDAEMGKVLWSAMVHAPWDHKADFATEEAFYEDLRKRCIELRGQTDRALMITCGCNLFEWGTFLRKMENYLMDTYLEPEKVIELNEQLMVRHLDMLKKVCDSVGDVVDILRFGDDLGMDTGMFMAREKYQELFKPYHTQLNDYVHTHSQMKTFLHSCGSIYPVMGDLIDAGYDIINPVQTTAKDMDPARLKQEFGKDITFWGGGCNTRRVLNYGSPEEVYEYSRKMIDIFYKDGGFVFNTEHNILPDVPPQNIMAMYKAVEDSRK